MTKSDDKPVVYIATSKHGVKIGVSRQLTKRMYHHRYTYGEHELVRTWRHKCPYAIELMVCRDLREYRARGRGWFSVTPETMTKCVFRAIRQYRAGKRPPRSKWSAYDRWGAAR